MIALRSSTIYILLTMEFILGNFANGFIMLVNCIDWIKEQKISIMNQMLLALSISRIGLLWVTFINWYIFLFKTTTYSFKLYFIIKIAWIISNHFSIWLATALSVFYLLKIAIFSRLFFIYLKRRVRSVVHILFLVSFPFLVNVLIMTCIGEDAYVSKYNGNMTQKIGLIHTGHFAKMIAFIIVNLIPFTISLASLVLLIFSLWNHFKKMKLSGKGCQDPSTKVHIRALQTVMTFLLFIVCYFIALVIQFWIPTKSNKLLMYFCQTLLGLYPSIHSFFLIWGNKKLKQAFLSFLWKLKLKMK